MPRPSGSPRDRGTAVLLRAPWSLLVVWPWVALSTAIGAVVAFLLSLARPEWAFSCGVLWARAVVAANGSRVTVSGLERVPPGRAFVIVSNHQSHFDVPALWSRWDRPFRFVLKAELRRVPFLGWYSSFLGNVFVDRRDRAGAMASLRAARPLLERGVSIWFFAEGTRSRDGRLQPFRKGAFVLAAEAGVPILPVTIHGTHRILPGGRLLLLPGHVRITIHEPVPTAGTGPDGIDALVRRVHDAVASGLEPGKRVDGCAGRPS